MLRSTLLAALFALALPVRDSLPIDWPVGAEDFIVRATPVVLDPTRSAERRLGALTFVAGWSLTADTPLFGGLSALAVDGARLRAVTDGGRLVTLRMRGPSWPAHSFALPRYCPWRGVELGRDTEAMAVDGDRLWFAAERRNAICRFGAGRPAGVAPPAMKNWPIDFGPETLIRLRDGRFVVFEEGGDHDVLLFSRDPVDPAARLRRLRYRPPAGYRPTDGTQLPDGRIIILNRQLTLDGFRAKLVLFDALPGRGRVIATIAPPLNRDNFEGISATREGAATMLWIISDNNNLKLQRTLLLKFRLDG